MMMMNPDNVCVEKLELKCEGGGVVKIGRRRKWSVDDDFDAKYIRRGLLGKSDSTEIYKTYIHLFSRLLLSAP